MADSNLADPFISGMLSGQEYQMNKLKLLEAPVKLEQEKLALKISQQDYDQRQKMADFLTKHSAVIPDGQNPMTNAVASLIDLSGEYAREGRAEEAITTLSKASTISAQVTDSAYKNWEMTLQKTKFADQMLATIPEGLSPEEGQKAFDSMNAMVYTITGQKSYLEGKKYSPQLMEELRKANETKRTVAQQALDKAHKEEADANTKAAGERTELYKTQEALNKQTLEHRGKVGDIQMAKPRTVRAVTDAIIKDTDDTMSTADARVFAEGIAPNVEARMTRDHQNLAQATASELEAVKKHGPPWQSGRVAPGTQKKPLPLPTDNPDVQKRLKNAKDDAEREKIITGLYKDQKWYNTPDGPQWYDADTQTLYPEGSGPDDGNDKEEEE